MKYVLKTNSIRLGTLAIAFITANTLAGTAFAAEKPRATESSVPRTSHIPRKIPSNAKPAVLHKMVINNDAQTTTSRNVTLKLTATGATHYRAAEGTDPLTTVPWIPFKSSVPFKLKTAGAGGKMVSVQVNNLTQVISASRYDFIMLEE
ncbi:MAG: hypothetical protein AB8C02_19355 [Halioglobus sp.]